jgi:hypothetical protein
VTQVRAVLVVLVFTLAGCDGPSPPSGGGSTSKSTTPVPPACACNTFPVPSACAAVCIPADAEIESVNTQEKTAQVRIRKGNQTINQTVPFTDLPTGVPAQAGAQFTALLKQSTTAEQPRITGLVRATPKP